ncbi:hypothetical protein MMC24_005200 [Lignoscripta atroalba]|nr:hypothetical protein [Lignoscripta atroalba]
MAFKRKRSSSGLAPCADWGCPSSSDSESSSTSIPFPQAWSSPGDNDAAMGGTNHQTHQIDNWTMTITPVTETTPHHLHSRTRKRFRDSRPDENTIHQNTYQKLFSAQRAQSPQPVCAFPRARSVSSNTSQNRSPPQASLHNFWALPVRRTNSHPDTYLGVSQQQLELKCEDCDACLGAALDNNSMTMDVDMGGAGLEETEHACRGCGRMVCEMCAVVVVGEGRECLQCKTSRKRWVGGIGWVQAAHM